MSEVVGYKLLDSEGAEVQVWGGTWGQTPAVPNPIRLPSGDVVHAPTVGASYQGYTLAAIEMEEPVPSTDPADYRLTKRQICAALIIGGIATDPDAWMLALLDHIEDDTTRALAINDWRYAPYYDRANPLFSDPDLMTAAGLTSGQIDGLWMTAKDLPA